MVGDGSGEVGVREGAFAGLGVQDFEWRCGCSFCIGALSLVRRIRAKSLTWLEVCLFVKSGGLGARRGWLLRVRCLARGIVVLCS
jgi:hypothetical protein